jgi:hypothetical protein
MESNIQERENTLIELEKQIHDISNVFRKSYLQKGRGALVAYTYLLEIDHKLSPIDYNTKVQSIDLFDNKKSRQKLSMLIDNYDPRTEGIMMVISKSNATWFVTVKLRSKRNH